MNGFVVAGGTAGVAAWLACGRFGVFLAEFFDLIDQDPNLGTKAAIIASGPLLPGVLLGGAMAMEAAVRVAGIITGR